MPIAITRIAEHLNGTLEGDDSLSPVGLAEIDEAGAEHLCYASSEKYLAALEASGAGAAIVPRDFPPVAGKTLIRVDDPVVAFIEAMELFAPERSFSGIHDTAVIAPSASLGDNVGIGPHVVIEKGAVIGNGVCIRAGAYIGADTEIGDGCDIGANAAILHGSRLGQGCLLHPGVCIGADGYGFRWLGDHHRKIPQLGIVVIGDNVEIGANSTIDRATMGETRIGEGTKIDNLVHIAHNNKVGRHVIMAGHVGIAGSSKIGDGAMLGGQAGVIDHVEVGAGTLVGAKSLVTGKIPAKTNVWGIPARPLAEFKKQIASLARLPDLQKQLKSQQKELDALKARLAELEAKL